MRLEKHRVKAFTKLRKANTAIITVANKTIDELNALLDADKAADAANRKDMPNEIKKDKHSSQWLKNRDEWRQHKAASLEWAREQHRAADKVITATDTFLCVMYDKVSAVIHAVERDANNGMVWAGYSRRH